MAFKTFHSLTPVVATGEEIVTIFEIGIIEAKEFAPILQPFLNILERLYWQHFLKKSMGGVKTMNFFPVGFPELAVQAAGPL